MIEPRYINSVVLGEYRYAWLHAIVGLKILRPNKAYKGYLVYIVMHIRRYRASKRLRILLYRPIHACIQSARRNNELIVFVTVEFSVDYFNLIIFT
jgi:hypothetical protein